MVSFNGLKLVSSSIDLLDVRIGTVTAPAGCGKSHLIAESLSHHHCSKPVLVLTHTVAGVASLREKIKLHGVPPRSYRLATIDGWAMRLIRTFPTLSGTNSRCVEVTDPRTDYPAIRSGALRVLTSANAAKLVHATYCRLWVDEYQDCSSQQHALVKTVSSVLPTCVLGDPLQAIFGFRGEQITWDTDVIRCFPNVGELNTPWRWINSGKRELGDWLLEVRRAILMGQQMDLRAAPASVSWVPLDGSNDFDRLQAAVRTQPPHGQGNVLIIADSKNKAAQYAVASLTPGATSVETADLADLVRFASRFTLEDPTALARLCRFCQECLCGAGVDILIDRLRAITRNGSMPVSSAERAAVHFNVTRTYEAAFSFLRQFEHFPEVRAYRPDLFEACIKSLKRSNNNPSISLREASLAVRDEIRARGRLIHPRTVGSTLLLKGLEAEVSIVLNADSLSTSDLYVAMTRASQLLVVCSRSPFIPSSST